MKHDCMFQFYVVLHMSPAERRRTDRSSILAYRNRCASAYRRAIAWL